MHGSTRSDPIVDAIIPPIIVIAMGARKEAPSPVPKTRGNSTITVVNVVIIIGLNLMPAALTSASILSAPFVIRRRAVAKSYTASLTAIPASTIRPIIAITPIGDPVGKRTNATPINERGIADNTVMG